MLQVYIFCISSKVASDIEQDVQMTNEKSVVNPYINPTSAGNAVDPGIHLWFLEDFLSNYFVVLHVKLFGLIERDSL